MDTWILGYLDTWILGYLDTWILGYLDTWILGYLNTWSGFEAAKTAPWPSRGLHHFSKFLEPSDE